jgi:WD40 repeat protein/serine/threonine protein kinase
LVWNQDEPPAQEIAPPPSVGQPKLAPWTPPETNDPVALLKATLQRIVSRAAESDEAPPKEIPPLFPPIPQAGGTAPSTNAPPIGPAISGSASAPPPSPPRRGNDSGTLDYSVTPPNFEELASAAGLPGVPTLAPSKPTVMDVPVPADPNAPADPGKKSGRGSVHATFDSAVLPPVLPGGKRPSTYDERRFAATMDSGNISPEDTERVAKLWQGTYSPSCTPRTSLKSKEGVRARDSKLVIKNRAVREATAITRKGADYELLNMIGEGGMGVVYAARQASIDRTVAVKMLKPDIAGQAEQREKFLSEAVVTGDLDHPNIVPIYDLGSSEGGALFYSMKRVQGTPWMLVIVEKSLAENVEILMKVADAVAFAHSRGVIHRDLKPENIMLGDFGEVLVMDWGLAMSTALFRKAESITQTSSMGGTPAYMAPEMATGPVDRIGPPADVYLLGAILYEIITGKPPHTGKNVMNCLFAAAKNEIQPTEHSGELLEIAMRAMSTSPADRPASVQDFQNGIREYQSHSESIVLSSRAEEDLARAEKSGDYQVYSKALFAFEEAFSLWEGNAKAKTGISTAKLAYAKQAMKKEDFDLGASLLDEDDPTHAELRGQILSAQRERDSRQQRLRNVKRALVGAAVLLVVVIAGALFRVNQEKDVAVAAEQKATASAAAEKKSADAAKKAEAQAKDDRDKAQKAEGQAKSDRDLAQKAEEQAKNDRDKANRAAEEARKARQLAEYQRYIATIGLAASKIDENSFDTADELLANSPGLYRNWEWGRLKYLTSHSVSNFVPPKNALAKLARPVNFQPGVAAQDAPAGQPLPAQAKDTSAAPIESVTFSRDGTKFVAGSWDGEARVWDVKAGKMLLTIPYGALYVHAVAFSPDGKYIALAGSKVTRGPPEGENVYVRLFNAKSGDPVRDFVGHSDDVVSVSFSSDSRRLLTGSFDKKAKLWDVETGRNLKTYFAHTWWIWSAAFSKDEKQIVTASQDGTVIVWNTESEQPNSPFTGHMGPVYSAAFSPDGQYVVSGGYDNRVLVWRTDDVHAFDYSGAIAADKDGYVTVSDPRTGVKTGRQRANPAPKFRELEGHTAPVRTVAFSPNGKMILSAGNDNTIKLWSFAGEATGESADGKAVAGKLMKSLRGHASWVRSAVFSPDGLTVLSAGHDAVAKIWDIRGYSEYRQFQARTLQGHADAILAAAFAKDGRRMVTASRDRTARTWDFETGKPLVTFEEGHDYLTSTALFFPDGKQLLTSAADNTARLWDLRTGTQSLRLDRTGRAAVAAVSHNGKLVATGSDENTGKIWNIEAALAARDLRQGDQGQNVKPAQVTKAGGAEITAMAFSPDDQFLATGDGHGGCAIWNVKTGALVKSSDKHKRKITAIEFTSDGKRVLTASTDNSVDQWDVTTGDEPVALNLRLPAAVVSMALVPQTRQALVLGDDHLVTLWDIDRAQLVKTLDARGADPKQQSTPSQLAVSADGRMALWADYEHRVVRLWDLKADREIPAPGAKNPAEPFLTLTSGQLWSAAFSPDGMNFVTVGGQGAHLRDIATAAERMSLSPSGVIAAANFSPDGKWIVTGSWDNAARIWDSETGKDVLKLVGHTGFVNSACFSPDGTKVLTASDDKTAKLWDARTGRVLVTFEGHADRVFSAVFSDDGRFVLTGSGDRTARLWDAATGKQLHIYKRHEWGVLSVAIWQPKPKDDDAVKNDDAASPNEQSALKPRIITGSADNTAIIWDLETGQTLVTLAGHTAGVASVAFSPDGKRVLTGSQDNAAKLWDAVTGKEILTLKAHAQEVTAVSFSVDGQYVLTASRDGTAILWLAAPWQTPAADKPPIAAVQP